MPSSCFAWGLSSTSSFYTTRTPNQQQQQQQQQLHNLPFGPPTTLYAPALPPPNTAPTPWGTHITAATACKRLGVLMMTTTTTWQRTNDKKNEPHFLAKSHIFILSTIASDFIPTLTPTVTHLHPQPITFADQYPLHTLLTFSRPCRHFFTSHMSLPPQFFFLFHSAAPLPPSLDGSRPLRGGNCHAVACHPTTHGPTRLPSDNRHDYRPTPFRPEPPHNHLREGTGPGSLTKDTFT